MYSQPACQGSARDKVAENDSESNHGSLEVSQAGGRTGEAERRQDDGTLMVR